ncbi:N-6 DNA methylase [Mesorhizobium caraganae]|uniref:N-6 DNA methylase n=1 Tax=Mesorhizobium caraganae TaxID=483206 RepID=UPI0035E41CED
MGNVAGRHADDWKISRSCLRFGCLSCPLVSTALRALANEAQDADNFLEDVAIALEPDPRLGFEWRRCPCRSILALITRGKILPELWGKTLVCRDFFDVLPDTAQYEVIIGNPPWNSRRGPARSSVQWSKKTGHPMPGGEDAWAFSWKALAHLSDGGLIAFLLPSMGFLHNHAQNTAIVSLYYCRLYS